MTDAPKSCPPYQVLDALVAGHSIADEVVRHVRSCEHCREQQAAIRANNELFSKIASHHSPPLKKPAKAPAASWTAPEGYTIIEEAHRGAQGIVFRAEQLATHRTIALKIMHAGRFASSHNCCIAKCSSNCCCGRNPSGRCNRSCHYRCADCRPSSTARKR